MERVEEILAQLTLLEDGWGGDIYARAINPKTIDVTRKTLRIILSSTSITVPVPQIGPTQAGRIDLSWHFQQDGREKSILWCTFGYNFLRHNYLQIQQDTPISYLMEASENPEESFEEDAAREILNILKDFFKEIEK